LNDGLDFEKTFSLKRRFNWLDYCTPPIDGKIQMFMITENETRNGKVSADDQTGNRKREESAVDPLTKEG